MLTWWALAAGGHKKHQSNTLLAYTKCNERMASLLRRRRGGGSQVPQSACLPLGGQSPAAGPAPFSTKSTSNQQLCAEPDQPSHQNDCKYGIYDADERPS